MTLQTYKCHKTVKAAKILDIVTLSNGLDGATAANLVTQKGHFIPVTQQYLDKHDPQISGYYVLDEDLYDSFSPAEAFESGYTLESKVNPDLESKPMTDKVNSFLVTDMDGVHGEVVADACIQEDGFFKFYKINENEAELIIRDSLINRIELND